jgi:hypothetical protein
MSERETSKRLTTLACAKRDDQCPDRSCTCPLNRSKTRQRSGHLSLLPSHTPGLGGMNNNHPCCDNVSRGGGGGEGRTVTALRARLAGAHPGGRHRCCDPDAEQHDGPQHSAFRSGKSQEPGRKRRPPPVNHRGGHSIFPHSISVEFPKKAEIKAQLRPPRLFFIQKVMAKPSC